MKVVCIGDTHGAHWNVRDLPSGDMLLFAGDITCHGGIEEVVSFNKWLGTLPYRYKVVIAGNHDRALAQDLGAGKRTITNGIYLQNEGTEIEGVRIWGSPLNVIQGDQWAFNKQLSEQAAMIPETDILLTHSAPFGILDLLSASSSHGEAGQHGGSKELAERLKTIHPKYHIFGHIHDGYGGWTDGQTKFFNVAMQDGRGVMFSGNRMIHDPVVIEMNGAERTEPWNDPVPTVDLTKYPLPWEATFIGRLREPPIDEEFVGLHPFYARPLEYSWTARRVTGSVLDVGGGTSGFAALLQKKGHTVTVCDVQDYSAHHKDVPFVLIDGKTLPFPDDSFDTVTCVSVLEHVEDEAPLIAEMKRVARRIVITTPYSHRVELLDVRTVPGPERLQRYYTFAGLLKRFDMELRDFEFCSAHGGAAFTCPDRAEIVMMVLERPEKLGKSK